MTVVSPGEKLLRVAASARLRWDKIEGRHVLLSPERGLALSKTATEIVQLCDGSRTASAVARACVDRYASGGGDAAKIEADVRVMVGELLARGLVVEV
jgi:pyrroloquinoline quinone biosynthesis protein D